MTIKYTVYTLSDPFTGCVKYVGLTSKSLEKRLLNHIRDSYRTSAKAMNVKKCRWIYELRQKGARPYAEEIETCDNKKEGGKSEAFWTNYFRFLGFDLLNISTGLVPGNLSALHKNNSTFPLSGMWKAAEKSRIGVVMLTKSGEQVNRFISISLASKITGIGESGISSCCKGRCSTAGGYIWRKEKEFKTA